MALTNTAVEYLHSEEELSYQVTVRAAAEACTSTVGWHHENILYG